MKYSQKYSPLVVKYALHNLFREFVGRLVLLTPNTSISRPGRFQENVEIRFTPADYSQARTKRVKTLYYRQEKADTFIALLLIPAIPIFPLAISQS